MTGRMIQGHGSASGRKLVSQSHEVARCRKDRLVISDAFRGIQRPIATSAAKFPQTRPLFEVANCNLKAANPGV
jgi:hypothetical protein